MLCARVFISNRMPDEGTIGSEEAQLLVKLARNPAQLNDLNRVANKTKLKFSPEGRR